MTITSEAALVYRDRQDGIRWNPKKSEIRSLFESVDAASRFALPYDDADVLTMSERLTRQPVSVFNFFSLVEDGDWTAAVQAANNAKFAVYFPGIFPLKYRIDGKVTDRPGGNLWFGDEVSQSIIHVSADTFNMSASAVREIPVSASENHAGIHRMGFEFEQPVTSVRAEFNQYPWAISARNVSRLFIGDVRITGGWNGFDLRDNTGGLMGGRWELGVINCPFKGGGADGASPALDFWNVDTIRVWPHGFQDHTRLVAWLDGAGEGTKLGRIDGVSLKSLGGYGVKHTLQGTAFDVSYVSDGVDLTYSIGFAAPGGAGGIQVYTETSSFVRTLLTQGVAYTVDGGDAGITLAAPVAAGLTIRIITTGIVYGPFGSIGDLKVDGNTAHLLAEAGEIAFGTVYGSTAVAGDYKIKSTGAKLTIPSWFFLGHPDATDDMVQVENGGSVHMGLGTSIYLGPNQSLASMKDANSVLTVIGASFGRCADQTRTKAFIRQSAVGGTLTAIGNTWEAIGTGTGNAVQVLDNGLHVIEGNNLNGWNLAFPTVLTGAARQGLYGPNTGPAHLSVAATGTLTLRPDIDHYDITAGSNIGNINPTYDGHVVTLRASAAVTFIAGGTSLYMRQAENFVAAVRDVIVFECRAGVWLEKSRSQNSYNPKVARVIAAADPLPLIASDDTVIVTGNTSFGTIANTYQGHSVRLIFKGTPTIVTNAPNHIFAGGAAFVATANDTLTIAQDDAGVWLETGRSVN